MTPEQFDKIVSDAAEKLGIFAGKDLKELHDSGVDITPLAGESVLGTIIRLKKIK